MCLLDTQVQSTKINWDPKDNKAGGHQCASIAGWVVFLLSLRKTELVGVVTILRPREVTFRQLFPRCMRAVWAKHSIMLLLSKGKIQGFSLPLQLNRKSESNPPHESGECKQTNKNIQEIYYFSKGIVIVDQFWDKSTLNFNLFLFNVNNRKYLTPNAWRNHWREKTTFMLKNFAHYFNKYSYITHILLKKRNNIKWLKSYINIYLLWKSYIFLVLQWIKCT